MIKSYKKIKKILLYLLKIQEYSIKIKYTLRKRIPPIATTDIDKPFKMRKITKTYVVKEVERRSFIPLLSLIHFH